MITLEILEALDGIQWLRTGDEVAKRFSISQPTVARYCKQVLDLFGLELERRDGEWDVVGDQTLLLMQRRVHQAARLRGMKPLRLEATYWSALTYCRSLPDNWILGQSNIVGIGRTHQLLRDRVIDCCLASLPDVPWGGNADFASIVLTDMPVFFVCSPNHPILARDHISYDDIAEYPTLALPKDAYPLVERFLQGIGLWNDGVRMTRYRRESWEGRTEDDLTIGYGTPLSVAVSGGNLHRLPLMLPFRSGDAIVARREFLDHPLFEDLIAHLNDQIALITSGIEGVHQYCSIHEPWQVQ